MTDYETLDALRKDLESPFYKKRMEAIRRARDLLQRPTLRDQIRPLLEKIATADMDNEVRTLAGDVLRAMPQKAGNFLPDDAKHMVGVKCKNGHVTWIDKRVVCGAKSPFVREIGGEHRIIVPCAECDEIMRKLIDCEGYK